MLTNIYYFGFYKPYIFVNANDKTKIKPKLSRITYKEALENMPDTSFLLNKSLNDNVVKYAKDITESVVGVKEAAFNIIRHMEGASEYVYEESIALTRRFISKDIKHFVNIYNKAIDFMSTQNHSRILKDYSERLVDTVASSEESLQGIFITRDIYNNLDFDDIQFETAKQKKLNAAIDNSLDTFYQIYDLSVETLTAPLSEHMNFRNLNFYYNYKYGSIYSDTFRIIQNGLIIDKVL